jgi:hypothetical protein
VDYSRARTIFLALLSNFGPVVLIDGIVVVLVHGVRFDERVETQVDGAPHSPRRPHEHCFCHRSSRRQGRLELASFRDMPEADTAHVVGPVAMVCWRDCR